MKFCKKAEMKFGTIDRRILFPLADHISFAADRILSGEQISNPLTEDIRVLFHSEYEVASQLKKFFRKDWELRLMHMKSDM